MLPAYFILPVDIVEFQLKSLQISVRHGSFTRIALTHVKEELAHLLRSL